MKKINARLLSVNLALALVAVLPMPVRAAEGEKLLVMGDSISAGYAVEKGQYAYYDYLTECEGYTLTNLAVSGHKTTDMMALMQQKDTQTAIKEADVISISIGANDMLTPLLKYVESVKQEDESYTELFTRLDAEGSLVSHVSKLSGYVRPYIEAAKTNLAQIEADILALNPDVKLVMQTIYNPVEYDETVVEDKGYGSSYNLLHNYVRNSTNMINEAILALEHTIVADVSSAFEGTGWIYVRVEEKDIHPTQLGHALIGATVLNALGVTKGESFAMSVVMDNISKSVAKVLPADDRAAMESYAMKVAWYSRGDVNNNSRVDSADAVLVLRQYNSEALLGNGDILQPIAKHAADVDQNSILNSSDAIGILKFYALSIDGSTVTWDMVYPA